MNIEQKVLQPGDQHYTIAVPANYPDEGPVPLILALHFAGHGTPFYGRMVLEELVEPALGSLGAIILAPDCTTEAWNNPQSEAVVMTLLDYISNSYAVDPMRVVVVGYSMGGSGAWYLAARHPGRFSAAIVMSGWPPDEIDLEDWQVPIYVIHSRQDELIPLERTQSSVYSLTKQGAEMEFIVLDGITHFETSLFREPLRSAAPWIKKVWQGNGE